MRCTDVRRHVCGPILRCVAPLLHCAMGHGHPLSEQDFVDERPSYVPPHFLRVARLLLFGGLCSGLVLSGLLPLLLFGLFCIGNVLRLHLFQYCRTHYFQTDLCLNEASAKCRLLDLQAAPDHSSVLLKLLRNLGHRQDPRVVVTGCRTCTLQEN